MAKHYQSAVPLHLDGLGRQVDRDLSSADQRVVYFTLDAAGTILSVNCLGVHEAVNALKLWVEQSIFQVFHPEDRSRLEASLSLCLQSPTQITRSELRQVVQDDRMVRVQATAQTVQGVDIEPIVLLVCKGIELPDEVLLVAATERSQSGLASRETAAFPGLPQILTVSPLLEGACPVGLFYADGAGRYLQVNDRWCELSGMVAVAAQNHGWLAAVHADDRDRVLAEWQQAIQSNQPFKSEYRFRRPDGLTTWVLAQAMAETDANGAIAGYVGAVTDISSFYRQVQRLNASLERQVQARTAQLQLAFDFEATLKRITDKVRDSLDENQILQTAVRELAITLGARGCNAALYDLEQGTSTICYEYTTLAFPYQGRIARMTAFPELYGQLLRGQSFQFCSLSPNPNRGEVVMLTSPIVDDQGVLGDLWLIDVQYHAFSEQDIRLVEQVANQCAIAIRQARLYQTAQAQVKELEKLNQLKDNFLSNVSHELRTPMASIKMATQLLEIMLQQVGIFDSEANAAARYLRILHEECQREIGLIDRLLDLLRLEAESAPTRVEPIDLLTWIPQIVAPFQSRVCHQNQTLELELEAALPPLMTNRADLEQILTELLSNACKYAPCGAQIAIAARVAAGQLQLSVCNSGSEIPLEERDRIFEKFYRIPECDRWQHGGVGLGLALVKKRIEHLGATIRVESSADRTSFIVAFPLE